jgi:hypothetical protein
MKLSPRPLVVCLGLFALVGLVAVVKARPVRSAPPSALRVTGGCPRHVKPAIEFGPAQWVAINRAIGAEVPRVFADLTSMGHKAWPRFQIRAVIAPLGGAPLGNDVGPPIRGFKRYVAMASRACGRRAAEWSALVILQFPNCQLPCSNGWAYLTPTHTGWHLWTSYQV